MGKNFFKFLLFISFPSFSLFFSSSSIIISFFTLRRWDAPTSVKLSIDKSNVQIGELFTLTAEAEDKNGLIHLDIWDGDMWHSKECGRQAQCKFVLQILKLKPGVYVVQARAWGVVFPFSKIVPVLSETKQIVVSPTTQFSFGFAGELLGPICFDGDGFLGENQKYVKSFVDAGTFIYGIARFYDYCGASNILYEAKCMGNLPITEKIECECEEGACKSEEGKEKEEECNEKGEKRCLDNFSYKVCGNYDEDPALEWSDPIKCEEGKICREGECIQEKIKVNLPQCNFEGRPGIWAKVVECEDKKENWIRIGEGRCIQCSKNQKTWALSNLSRRGKWVIFGGEITEEGLSFTSIEFCKIDPIEVSLVPFCASFFASQLGNCLESF